MPHEHRWDDAGRCEVLLAPGVPCYARRCRADVCTGKALPTLDYCAAHPAYKHPFPIDGGQILVRG